MYDVCSDITISHVLRHGVTTVVRRTVRGDRMEVSMECKGVTATAIFRRKEVFIIFIITKAHFSAIA